MSSKTYRTLTTGEGRTIGYNLIEAADSEFQSTAVVYFYPLSFSSLLVDYMHDSLVDSKYQCSFLCVDRPENRSTSALLAPREKEDVYLHRIRGHIDDVEDVLEAIGIERVYIVGACLGHPFAVELARRLVADDHEIHLEGLSLVAPFVSTATESSWYVARLGKVVPESLLHFSTEAFSHVGDLALSSFLNVSHFKSRWNGEESDNEMQKVLELVQTMAGQCQARGLEARLGVSDAWQSQVCDRFAVESGCGLYIEDATTKSNVETSLSDQPSSSQPKAPIKIYATADDKLAPMTAVEWLAKRCYGGESCIHVEWADSHEGMILFGQTPRRPTLLHKILTEWGLRPKPAEKDRYAVHKSS